MAEAVWVLAGSGGPWIYGFNARLGDFADDGVLRGAYGPRLRAGRVPVVWSTSWRRSGDS